MSSPERIFFFLKQEQTLRKETTVGHLCTTAPIA